MLNKIQGGVAGVSPRTGRPTSNPKEERLTVRIDKVWKSWHIRNGNTASFGAWKRIFTISE